MNRKVLYIEDDESIAYLTKDNLELNGYIVFHELDGAKAIDIFKNQDFDICLLDIMLPNTDGFTLAKEIRKLSDHIPIIFLTAKSLLEAKLEGLTLGADDYLTKPYSMKELLLRMEVIFRRSAHVRPKDKVISNLTLQTNNYSVCIDNQQFKLTEKEYKLLELLVDNCGNTLKRSDILLKLWGNDDFFLGRSLDVFISRLRKILSCTSNIKIENVHGVGFRLIELSDKE